MKIYMGLDGSTNAASGSGSDTTGYSQNRNYEFLKHKPTINGKTLIGNIDLHDLGFQSLYYDTTENWNAQKDTIAARGSIYIYSDYKTSEDEEGNITLIPGIKIGDGTAYLIDAPFITEAGSNSVSSTVVAQIGEVVDLIQAHIANKDTHVSAEDRLFWNNKVTAYLDPDDDESLILTKD